MKTFAFGSVSEQARGSRGGKLQMPASCPRPPEFDIEGAAKPTIPSPQISGCANIIQPARKTKRKMEMSKGFDGSAVSSFICGEV